MAGRTDPDPDAPDYYGLVGVDREASQGEVDGAITRAKGHYHPDQSSLDEARASRCFDRVRDAEAVLTDPDSREVYDTFLDRFGPEAGHDEFQEWDESGGQIDPADWERSGDTVEASGQTPDTGSTTGSTRGSSTGSTRPDTGGSTTTRQRRSTSRSHQRSSTSDSRRRSTSRQRSSTDQSQETTRQRASTARSRRSSASARGSQTTRRERYRGWQGSVRNRFASARERIEEGRLSALLPVLERLDRGLDQLVRPGLFVRQYVPRLGQFAAVSATTVGAFLFVGNTDSILTLLGPLLWVVATIVLYAGGAVIWGTAAVATYLFEGYGPALYTSVTALVAVSLYYLLIVLKTDQMADAETE
jgi:curved DNA-binding protein CbpA